MYEYRRLLATISPLGFYVLVHYGSQYFYGLKEKENVLNQSGVQLDFCCCALDLEIYFKVILYYITILPDNKFNHLNGVNKQPYCGNQNLSITFDQLMFLFLFSTAVPRSTLQ